MTTPNGGLISMLRAEGCPDWVTARWLMESAADLLQSQAERIKELEASVEHWKAARESALFAGEQMKAELAAIAATEPVATINDLSNSRMFTLEANGYSRKDKLFTRPMPAQRLTELKLLMLTTAYEQGVGKGIQRRDCNPYAADTDEHAAWKLGYEEGLDKPMPAQDVTELVELREWQAKAFEAHPNIDLDIAALSKYKGAK